MIDMKSLLFGIVAVLLTLTGCDDASDFESKKATHLYDVARAVDGDTIQLRNGDRIRLIGIDTPERGHCGYEEATEQLAGMVEGKRVELLSGSAKRTDRYGRFLYYVVVDGRDAGAELIKSGRAIARYDSRDGYGIHPREPYYINLDRDSPNRNVC